MKIGIVAERDTWSLRADRLASAGHDVTLLATASCGEPESSEPSALVRREALPSPQIPMHAPDHRVRAALVHHWLQRRDFDVVHLDGEGGAGFFALAARGQGLAHSRTTFTVEAGLGTLATRRAKGDLASHVDLLEIDFMEREVAARADAVHGDARAARSWAEQRGGALPGRVGPSADELEAWLSWHTALDRSGVPEPATPVDESEPPLVSVCIALHDRHPYLRQALESVRNQEYGPIEVVLVDDGSTDPETLSLLSALEPELEALGWRLVRQENLYLGAARNRAVREARGEFVLFLDDDDWLPPHALATFMRAALTTEASITTSFVEFFGGDEAPPASDGARGRWLPLGAAVEAGAFRNVFGAATSLVRKDVFDWLGGFTEDYGVGHEDWELYAAAVLEGFRLEVVPESLLWYRKVGGTMLESTSSGRNVSRSLRPYLGLGAPHDAIVELAAGAFHAQEGLAFEQAERERSLTEAVDEKEQEAQRLRDDIARLRAREGSDLEKLLASARLLASRGRAETVRGILDEVEALATSMGHPSVVMSASSEGAAILAELGHVEQAERWLVRAIDAGERSEDLGRVLGVLLASAETLMLLGRNEIARQHLASAIVLAHRTNDERAVTSTLLPQATVHAGLGEDGVAWGCLERASGAARDRGDARTLARSLLKMAGLAERRGATDDVAKILVDAMRAARDTGETGFLLEVLTEASEQLRRNGARGEATSVLRSAETLARQSGNALAYARVHEMAERLEAEPGA